jgi:chromosome segregation ATPase
MAGRQAAKAGGKAAPVAARGARAKAKGTVGGTLAERLAAIERERNALKDELERTNARVRQLEETNAKVRDRIAWALDTLHGILERRG